MKKKSVLLFITATSTLFSVPVIANAAVLPTNQANQALDPAIKAVIQSVLPTKQDLAQVRTTFSGKGYGTYSKSFSFSNGAKIKALLSNPKLSPELESILKSIPTSVTDTVTIQAANTPGDPEASNSVTEYDSLGIPVWKYSVSQDFSGNGTDVTYVSPAVNTPSPYYPGWNVSNVSNSLSTPIPYSYVNSYNEAVFTYTPYDITTIETQNCEIYFSYFGDDGWSTAYDVTTS